MLPGPPRSTVTDLPFPYTPRFRSAVDRRQQPGRPCVDQPRERLMVWPMETIDPLVAISSRVARNDVAVARRRDQRGMIGLAMQIYHRSEEHTSELQSLMRISYAVFCLKQKKS